MGDSVGRIFDPDTEGMIAEPENVVCYSLMMIISIMYFCLAVWSIYQENKAHDPENLKNVRSAMCCTTFWQIICFLGYWMNLIIMYEISWVIWVILSTYTIMLMGLKYYENYIILATQKYQLKNHDTIPRIYNVLAYLLLFFGFCLNIVGSWLGPNDYIQPILYGIWEISRMIMIVLIIRLLKSLNVSFRNILQQKAVIREEKKLEQQKRREDKQKKKSLYKQRKKHRSQQMDNNPNNNPSDPLLPKRKRNLRYLLDFLISTLKCCQNQEFSVFLFF